MSEAVPLAVPLAVPAAPAPAATLTPPAPTAVARALLGFALGGALVAPSVPTLGAGLDLSVVAPLGALVLTGPALLVGSQFLGLHAAPRDIVTLIARAFVRSGDLALAFCPAILLFAATSGEAPGVLLALLLGNGAFTLLGAVLDLTALEEAASASLAARGQMFLLAAGWAVLAGLIALRIVVSAL